jgi:hypothetical protein
LRSERRRVQEVKEGGGEINLAGAFRLARFLEGGMCMGLKMGTSKIHIKRTIGDWGEGGEGKRSMMEEWNCLITK